MESEGTVLSDSSCLCAKQKEPSPLLCMYDEELRLKKSFQATTNYNYLTYRDYDMAGRIIRLRTEKKTGEAILDVRYEYDANSNRTKDIDIINTKRVEYDYDTINQLLEERYYDAITGGNLIRKHTYQYDLLDNRTQRTVTVGATTTTTNYAYSATANEIQSITSWQSTSERSKLSGSFIPNTPA